MSENNISIDKVTIVEKTSYDSFILDQIVTVHMKAFTGFFLTSLGKGFLKQLYKGFNSHQKSGLIVAVQNDEIIGFLAYSEDLGAFYKYLIRKRIIFFAWYSFCAAIKKPSIIMKLLSAFLKPRESKRDEKYIQISSIGVLPQKKGHNIGSNLIDQLKEKYDSNKFDYIKLETDAVNNESVNSFYVKNGFQVYQSFATPEGRLMNEYRWNE